jgi:hypothetical protein
MIRFPWKLFSSAAFTRSPMFQSFLLFLAGSASKATKYRIITGIYEYKSKYHVLYYDLHQIICFPSQ